MKILFSSIALLLFAAKSVLCQEVSMGKLDSSQYMDFWVGTWEGTWPEGEKTGKAINKLTWGLGGKVLQENFEIVEGQSKGFAGGSLSVFNPNSNTWKQAWADSQGGFYEFLGAFSGNQRIFKTKPKLIGVDSVIQRMRFYDISSDDFFWDWELSRDNGKTWELSWRITYSRLKE